MNHQLFPAIAIPHHFAASHSMMACRFVVKTPAECMLSELFYFFLLVKKGGKVSTQELTQKIYGCQLLAFCYLGDKLVGISAIKMPSRAYILQVHAKAGITRNINNYSFELGYSFTEPELRQMGISRTLKEMLQNKIKHLQGTIFSTTAVPTSQRYLLSQGFIPCGNPYNGIFDDGIVYFEKQLS
ncbi:hypothetical protein [Pedobacter aquatilis]|uniref:hypothetical protein n=1 Tax=Pedobacter aquatilis TaxID=351343 RepID=UPI0029313657|nr:hypothetical protein [Pedobacter aquatilis]